MQIKLVESTALWTPIEVGPESYSADINMDELTHDVQKIDNLEDWNIELLDCKFVRIYSDKDITVTIGTAVIEISRFFLMQGTIASIKITGKEDGTTVKIIAGK